MAGVFGPTLAAQGHAGAELLLPLIFALILATVVLHGFTLSPLAQRLDLSAPRQGGLLIAGASAWSRGLAQALHELDVPVLLADSAWHRLRQARLAGVPVYFGELLSEQAEISLELGEMDSLLATTSNDSYNALVCAFFAPELGRQRVFQLAAGEQSEHRRPAPGARGLTAFGEDLQYEDLQRGWYRGWTFQRTRITEDFDLDAFLSGLPEGPVPLLVVEGGTRVRLLAANADIDASPGDRIIWFGPKKEDGKTRHREDRR